MSDDLISHACVVGASQVALMAENLLANVNARGIREASVCVCVCVCVCVMGVLSRSVVPDSAAPWTAAHQNPLSSQTRILEWVAISFSREFF